MPVTWLERSDLERAVVEHVERTDVVLDIGPGIRPQSFFRPRLHVCCEPHGEYVEVLQRNFASDPGVVVLQATGEEATRLLPDDSVDSVFLMDVIEHMEKGAGRGLLRECERVARRQVVVSTPLGFLPQEVNELDAWGMHGGHWQEHQSGWTPEDFEDSWDVLAVRRFYDEDAMGERLSEPAGAFWAIKTFPVRGLTLPLKPAVISALLPPSPSGQPMMLYRLLQELDPSAYTAISCARYDFNGAEDARLPTTREPLSFTRLSVPYFHLPPAPALEVPGRVELMFAPVLRASRFLMPVLHRARHIARIVRQEGCDAVLACSGDLFDLPAGFLASRWARLPFYAYMFDDYQFQWPHPSHRAFARAVERVIVPRAARLIVPNEFLADEYLRRYGVRAQVVPNASDLADELPEPGRIAWPFEEGETAIVYTGAVYHAQFDAFRNLVKAIKALGRPELRLHIYTSQPPALLEQQGISGPVTIHPHLPQAEAREVQRRADVLFLPLSFETIPEVIRTSAPGKMAEYLGSGRPVLVHAPPGSFVASYFGGRECGVVVSDSDPAQLAEAVTRICVDAELRDRLVENALASARSDFDLAAARRRFKDAFGGKRPRERSNRPDRALEPAR